MYLVIIQKCPKNKNAQKHALNAMGYIFERLFFIFVKSVFFRILPF